MQACPYDALYIDPDTHTAAKCNYCAHRVDVGLEPACVNVCPEHAIISGDMDDPDTEIAQLLSRQQVKVRKPEKGTVPNLFYIDADDASLNPSLTEKSNNYFWNSQERGVGHYAKQAEKMAFTNPDVVQAVIQASGVQGTTVEPEGAKSIDVLLGKPRRIYDSPDKGILWGWEVSAYVFTKAISAGAFLIPFLAWAFGWARPDAPTFFWALGLGLLFLGLTGLLLVKDLDRPDRFLNVLFRPQWKSWLVRGGYTITAYGALITLLALINWFGWFGLEAPVMWLTALVGVMVAIYTAFLFAQAKGRDFWQSPTLAVHMLVHSFMAGAAAFLILNVLLPQSWDWTAFLQRVMMIGIGVNLFTMLMEMTMTHPTVDAKRVVHMILEGRYRNLFWMGTVLIGNVLPVTLLVFAQGNPLLWALAAVLVLVGIYVTEKIWVEAPQRIPLS